MSLSRWRIRNSAVNSGSRERAFITTVGAIRKGHGRLWRSPATNRTIEYASFLAGMRLSPSLRIGALAAAICLCIQGQNTQSKDAQIEAKGMPPRPSPAEYQAHGQAGAVTIGAEFTGRSVPTVQGPLATEDYVAIEIGVLRPARARAPRYPPPTFHSASTGRSPCPASRSGLVVESVKDPEWAPPEPVVPKQKTVLNSGESSAPPADSKNPPPPPKVPIEIQRGWAQRVQRVALPEGDRPPASGRTDFLPVPRQDRAHRFDGADLRWSRWKSHAEAPAIAKSGRTPARNRLVPSAQSKRLVPIPPNPISLRLPPRAATLLP
jgi:hypothetical protein